MRLLFFTISRISSSHSNSSVGSISEAIPVIKWRKGARIPNGGRYGWGENEGQERVVLKRLSGWIL
jgi:hypothetical protein